MKTLKIFGFLFLFVFTINLSMLVHADEKLQGVSLQSPTIVYQNESLDSSHLKTYEKGKVLKYTAHSSDWYKATVSVNGKWQNGFIFAKDVETLEEAPRVAYGIALLDSVKVLKSTSLDATSWKSYSQGTLLKFETFTNDWYRATVYVKGIPKTGYISKRHVEEVTAKPEEMNGIALLDRTPVYSKASRSSSQSKTYSKGTVLKYTTFTKDWFQATIYVKGTKKTGYIHRSHAESVSPKEERETLKGIALKNPTVIYQKASINSNDWKTYRMGSILKYETFSKDWYIAKIYVNGKAKTGYIHRSDVENALSSSEQRDLRGIALLSYTSVYEDATKHSPVLKTYTENQLLDFRTFSNNWYAVSVLVNGKEKTGYLYKNDVKIGDTKETPFSFTFQKLVDKQMAASPQTSNRSNGGWNLASRSQVEYYANPSNFGSGSSNYYQFLVLSQPTGLNPNEVNEKILKGMGILEGKADAFIQGANEYKVNEVYLIAHAKLETGNGTSELATGILVNKINGVPVEPKMVYNMYGIGARDACPLTCGAQTAYVNGWFTPEDAIIGGAQFVGEEYIHNDYKQDTLYEMRWNPKGIHSLDRSVHQYATDIGWAAKQTATIKQIYSMIDDYTLVFDIPTYLNQPSSSGVSDYYENYPTNVVGKTVTPSDVLNMRSGPGTGYGFLLSIPHNSTIKITGRDQNNWYKVEYKGKEGWVSGDYVTVLNLLEITTSNLNVRSSASISSSVKGILAKRELVAAALDENNNVITQNEWYNVYVSGEKSWISGGANGTEYVKVK